MRVCLLPKDPGERRKRTVTGCEERLRACEVEMENTRGTAMNTDWLYWYGEWGTAFEWLTERHPKAAARIILGHRRLADGEKP